MLYIFDLDETVIDSKHRTPNNSDGSLNLEGYIKNHNRKNVFKDKLLPLARFLKNAIRKKQQVIILTARDMKKADYDFLYFHGLAEYNTCILSRDKSSKDHYKKSDGEYKLKWLQKLNLEPENVIIFDDAKPVKTILRKNGFIVLCPHKINQKLKTR